MGMSASQARLIALTARMSDVEYEGQQINQQRLALSNKISDIYAQLEAMTVPTPPSPYDYMRTEYTGKSAGGENSYKVDHDGNGALRLSKLKKDGNVVREGNRSTVSNAKIKGDLVDANQFIRTDNVYDVVDDPNVTPDRFIVENVTVADPSKLFVKTGSQTITDKTEADKYGSQAKANAWTHKVEGQDGFEKDEPCAANAPGATPSSWEVPTYSAATSISAGTEYFSDKYGQSLFGNGSNFVDINKVSICQGSRKDGFKLDGTAQHGATATVAFDHKPEGFASIGVADARVQITESDLAGLYVVNDNGEAYPATADNALTDRGELKPGFRLIKRNDETGSAEFTDGQNKDNPIIGGCSTMSIDEARQQYEGLNNAQSVAWDAAINGLKHSFPDDYQNFTVLVSPSGEFSFCLTSDINNGDDTVQTYVPGKGDYWEVMDGEINPKFDSTGLASINVNGEEINLTREQVVDEIKKAELTYKYERQKAQYDEEQNALNNKTSTYQMEDKKLDLKLKRLDTERNAINTEIDAVKKVIQDATEKGFKTFSG